MRRLLLGSATPVPPFLPDARSGEVSSRQLRWAKVWAKFSPCQTESWSRRGVEWQRAWLTLDAPRVPRAQAGCGFRSAKGAPRRTASAVVHVRRLGVFSPEADVFVGLRRILAPRESRRYEDTRSARNVAPSSANLVPGRGRAARRLTPFALCVSAAAVASACSADGSQPRWPAIWRFH